MTDTAMEIRRWILHIVSSDEWVLELSTDQDAAYLQQKSELLPWRNT
jgi:hypothetical protein